MATLKNRIELSDGVSPVLDRINNAAQRADSGVKQIANTAQLTADRLAATTNAADRTSLSIQHLGSTGTGALPQVEESVNNLNSRLSATSSLLRTVRETAASAFGVFTMSNMAASAIMGVASSIAEIPRQTVRMADTYSSLISRLGLIVKNADDVSKLNDAIYFSALRARGSYVEMADAVAQVSLVAKNVFPDPGETIKFIEGIQKLFVVGGTDALHAQYAMLQLKQALGSGKLQGDELRSIAESAPMIETMIAKEMGVAQGQLKQLGAEGKITSDIVKKAILNNMDEINADFAKMPMTFGQAFENMGTIITRAFAPVYTELEKLTASPALQAIGEKLAAGLFYAGAAIAWCIDLFYQFSDSVAETAEWAWNSIFGVGTSITDVLIPALVFATTLVTIYGIALAVTNASAIAAAVANTAHAIASKIAAAASFLFGGALAFVTAMLHVSTVGAYALLTAFVIIPTIVAIIIAAFLAWRVATHGLRDTFISCFQAIGSIIDSVVNTAIEGINKFIQALNKFTDAYNNTLGKILGRNLRHSTEIEFRSHASQNMGRWAANTFDYGAAKLEALKANVIPEMPDLSNISVNAGPQISTPDIDTGNIGKNTGKTADNTGKIADSMDILENEVKDLKEFANQEMINYYTNKEYKVTVGDINNSINRPADIDGVIDQVTMYIMEGMNSGAEAVHA